MPIAITCPSCAGAFLLREECAGQRVRCACGTVLVVPFSPVVAAPTTKRHPLWFYLPAALLALSLAVGAGALMVMDVLQRSPAAGPRKAPESAPGNRPDAPKKEVTGSAPRMTTALTS